MRPIAFLLSSIALVLATLGGTGAPSLPAVELAAASQGAANAAGVVIADPDGGAPKTVCVRFSEDSISGKQLLDRADEQLPSIDPKYARFGGQGHAVCSLCGEGCEPGDCFCQSRYWNYNVARDGAWVRSGSGVDRRVVEHGDVDGWAFGGDGAAPPYLTFEQICGPTTEPSPTAAAEPSPTTTAEPSPTAAAPPPSPDPATPGPTPPDPPSPDAEPSPTASSDASPGPAAEPTPPSSPTGPASPTAEPGQPAPSPSDDDVAAGAPARPSGTGGMIAFIVILGVLISLVVWRRTA